MEWIHVKLLDPMPVLCGRKCPINISFYFCPVKNQCGQVPPSLKVPHHSGLLGKNEHGQIADGGER